MKKLAYKEPTAYFPKSSKIKKAKPAESKKKKSK